MSAGVILVDREGRVLMQLRDDNPKIMYPGHWGITGGAALKDESPEETARREVTEETGLSLGRIEPFRAYYSSDGPNGAGAHPTGTKSKAEYELYLYHAPCQTPAEELVCGEGRELRFFSPEELAELDIAYNHAIVLDDFFGSPAYVPYVNGAAFDDDARIDALTLFRAALDAGDPWFDAMMRAIALWESPRETVSGRQFQYLIGGEAFDWLLLAERLLEDAAIPAEDAERMLFEAKPPPSEGTRGRRLSDEELRDLIGEHKHRAHLNFLYGVVVEEALQYAAELDVAKERASVNIKDVRFEEGAEDPVFERIYGATRLDLLRAFREERGAIMADHIALSEWREFMYWLFKYRVKNQEPARVASDTRKALAQLSRIQAAADRREREPEAEVAPAG
jgi:8-oxo-dGTP pyrophosphatase MutT (NUDIX family)